MRSAARSRRRSGRAADRADVQPRADRLHAAEAALGARARAARRGRACGASCCRRTTCATGSRASAPRMSRTHRARCCSMSRGRRWSGDMLERWSSMPRSLPRAYRVTRGHRHGVDRRRGRDRAPAGHAGRRWRRRPGRGRGRHGHRARRARSARPSAHRAWSSRPPTGPRSTRVGACTRSVTRCPAGGTSWA